MALYLAARQCTKLGNFPRIATQMRAISKSNMMPLVTNQLKTEVKLIRNISLTAPKLSAAQGSHSALWTAERALSLGLLALLPAAIAMPNPVLDYALAVSIVMHTHWGLEAIVTDYIRPIIFGNMVPKVAHGLLIGLSAITLAGLFYFIYNDIGIGKDLNYKISLTLPIVYGEVKYVVYKFSYD